tara:strand:+ start:119 stop:412 length:294 start_codon:yes stop_codon:yes gene_type:complete
MNIYEIGDNNYWTGRVRVISNDAAAPPRWTRTLMPTLLAGEYARWLGSWTITTVAPVTIAQLFDDTIQAREIAAIKVATRLVHTQRITARLVFKGQI